jgi:hypothetical protein
MHWPVTGTCNALACGAVGCRVRGGSPLYDKGHPILGVFVHGRSFFEFSTPKVPLLKSPGD